MPPRIINGYQVDVRVEDKYYCLLDDDELGKYALEPEVVILNALKMAYNFVSRRSRYFYRDAMRQAAFIGHPIAIAETMANDKEKQRLSLLLESCDRDHPMAQFIVAGIYYDKGHFDKALMYMEKSKNQGFKLAEFAYNNMIIYQNKKPLCIGGLKFDMQLSERWWLKLNMRNALLRFYNEDSLLNIFRYVKENQINVLELGNSKIRSIPDSISELDSLRFLDISKNKLTEFPLKLTKLNNLVYLDISSNPCCAPIFKNSPFIEYYPQHYYSYFIQLKMYKGVKSLIAHIFPPPVAKRIFHYFKFTFDRNWKMNEKRTTSEVSQNKKRQRIKE